jgi:hypothetical protein
MNRDDYEARALHFAEIGMYAAAQVFATLALAEEVKLARQGQLDNNFAMAATQVAS